jgi:hypothetical protein
MLTVRRRKPSGAPYGDYQAICDYCGVQWYRMYHGMRRDRSGRLSCRDCKDYEGRDEVSLSESNAMRSIRQEQQAPRDGANFDRSNIFQEAVHYNSGSEFEL